MQQQSELPEGWVSAKFEEFTQNLDGKRIPLKSSDRKNRQGQYPYYGASGIIDYIDDYIFDGKFLLISEDGANLVARNTPIAFIANGQFWVNNHAHIVKTFCNIPLEYLSFFFSAVDLFPFITGSAQPKLTKSNLSNIKISLPPLAEQHRIVSAIESLFARLDAANERLDRVPEILKKFRQSVLAAACDGRLTEGWREENPDIESAEELLIKIAQLNDSDLKKNLKSIIEFKEDLKELPEEWRWTKLGMICKIIMGQSPPGESYNSTGNGTPLINGPVEFGPTAFSKIILSKYTSKPKKMCQTNDLLLCVRGSTTGRMNIAGFNACVGRGVAAIRSFAYQPYVNFVIHSKEFEILNLGKGSTFPNINFENICNIPIPLPPLPEQHEIVRRVDALFALADSIEAKVAAAQERTEKLRQSILAKAFSGELVEIEAELARREGRDYEPADVLLERIKAKEGKSGKKSKAAK